MSLMSLVLVSLPEAILITLLGFQLTGLKIAARKVIIIGVLQATMAYFIRLSPFPFGLHTIFQLALFIMILKIITGKPAQVIAVTALMGITVYLSLESVIAPALLSLTGYALSEVIEDPIMRIFFFLPEAAVIFIIIIASMNYDFRLMDFSSKTDKLLT